MRDRYLTLEDAIADGLIIWGPFGDPYFLTHKGENYVRKQVIKHILR